MTTALPSSDDYFQEDKKPCHKAQIISKCFLERDNELAVPKQLLLSPDLNPVEYLLEREIHIMDVPARCA